MADFARISKETHEPPARLDKLAILTEGEYKAHQLAALGLLERTAGAAERVHDTRQKADDSPAISFVDGHGTN